MKLLSNKWFLLSFIALTWGSSFILIKKSLIGFSPYQIGAFRVALSGLLLAFLAYPALRKISKRDFFWVALTGFFGNFVPMFLFPLAQLRVSSSLAGILDSLVPAFVLILGFLFFGVKSKWMQVIGVIVGFLGVVLLIYFSDQQTEESQIGYAMLVVLATACYAMAAIIIKEKLQNFPSMALSASVFAIWMVPSLFILLFTGFFTIQATPEILESLGYLSILTVVGTAFAMILYYRLIQNTSPVFASSVTLLLPLVAVVWGLIDQEKFTIWHIFGGVLILSGIYMIQEREKTNN